jgi:4-amino-4-deoxy-L-arabinose transferase-like glycosyltransferase
LRQGLRASRLWLALILVFFCLPLFVGLGRADLETDEAIYSFAVDRILEIGDWLQPKSSPSETAVFLEKPPLKFWIVATPILAGLLPHDEFGLRFWDVVFGGAAFLYVFALGVMLAGPVCGAVAVLILFVHGPLLFEHGLRTNNMEAPLFLSYCGGVYHYLRWQQTPARSVWDPARSMWDPALAGLNPPEGGSHRKGAWDRSAWHAIAAGLYFVLGFMTKFIAVAFLPFVLLVGSLLFRDYRTKLLAGWRLWLRVAGLVVLLIAPWFVYAQLVFGSLVWHTMLAEHVYTRFTTYLDPAHVHPWHYYFTNMYDRFADSGSQVAVGAGLVLLLIQTVRRRWPEGAIVLLWAFVPVAIISSGSSKLYHYVFPFLPPLALAGGYLAGLAAMLAPAPLRRVLEWLERQIAARFPGLVAGGSRAWARRSAAVVIVVAAALAVGAVIYGQVRLTVGQTLLFKSSGTFRPALAILIAAVLTRQSARVARFIVIVAILGLLPIFEYENTFTRMLNARHPIRTTTDCVRRIQAARSDVERGLYVDVQDNEMWHPVYYYFRKLQPWTRAPEHAPQVAVQYLDAAAGWRPMLLGEPVYRAVMKQKHASGERAESAPSVSFPDSTFVGPGPYAACSTEGALQQRR